MNGKKPSFIIFVRRKSLRTKSYGRRFWKTRTTLLEKDTLLYKKTTTGQAAYLAPIFRRVYLERAHKDYGHLGWPGLNGALQNRVWWTTIEKDVQNQIQMCPGQRGRKLHQRRLPTWTLQHTTGMG
jgi:hypothetical protein